jgi:hypothetical protein
MLREATRLSGKTGEAAKIVANLMQPHFVKEEEYALPPLGLLPVISSGSVSEEMKEIILLIDKLKEDLPEMLEEHQRIVEALQNLMHHAADELHPEVVDFPNRISRTDKADNFSFSFLNVNSYRFILNLHQGCW